MASLFKQTAVTQRQGIVYPERVILANLSHGSITVKKDGNEKTFVMPAEISVKRAWAWINREMMILKICYPVIDL